MDQGCAADEHDGSRNCAPEPDYFIKLQKEAVFSTMDIQFLQTWE